MTLARRICALMELDGEGRLKGVPTSAADGEPLEHIQSVCHEMLLNGVDEIWLRLCENQARGISTLYEPLRRLRPLVNLPIVAWGQIHSEAEARLLLNLGADRVLVDLSELDPLEPIETIHRFLRATAPDQIVAAILTLPNAENPRLWEFCDAAGQTSHLDLLPVLDRMVSMGVSEVAFLPVPPHLSQTLDYPYGMLELAGTNIAAPLVMVLDHNDPWRQAMAAFMKNADAVVFPVKGSAPGEKVKQLKWALMERQREVRPPIGAYLGAEWLRTLS